MGIAALFGVPAGVLLLIYALFLNGENQASPLILLPVLILTPLTLSTVVMGLVRGMQEEKARRGPSEKRDGD